MIEHAATFRELRLEGFARQPRAFRFAPEDEASMPPEAAARRLEEAHVVGGFAEGALHGVAGFSRTAGAKLSHKGLLWGMYVRDAARGTGLADAIMRGILEHARTEVETVLLTVVADNGRARRFYERWGFAVYGVEPRAVRLGDGDYLDEVLMAKRLR
jgi:GNAT superfamily N-acetyltransferase